MVVEVAHIYPYSMSSVPRSSSFWTTLKLYWSEERINQWKAAVFGEKGGEACSNLLTLAPSVHAYWGRALFALKPLDVSDDGKSIEVQLFWLRPYHRLPEMRVTTSPELPSNLSGLVQNVMLFNCETREIIPSGTVITIRTDDPDTKPLPNKAILDMQWVLHRLTALSGGADVLELDLAPDDNDSDGSFHLNISDETPLTEGVTLKEYLDTYEYGSTEINDGWYRSQIIGS
ncbi:hypothetical protein I7I53_04805 [Histoplasma capsulatum var. duboisii H88]|uniref:HNH nuclease domain-containing protein n=1 Tax=Ajellomyces capsulatus (strain H88) TaxID=544711 RepID=A0A8A1LXA3_AJEC8|nr:hypothetical protein I7I53_04805 [Histoplasma capsulatum var. duboisii H88]